MGTAHPSIYSMPEYRRAFQPGGTFFFTVVTHERRPIFRSLTARRLLLEVIEEIRNETTFNVNEHVILPDHLHSIWLLPDNDSDFSTRWSRIKRLFTKRWLAQTGREEPISASRAKHRERGVWQRRFWEHTIRDEDDMIRHVDYIHFNPVKHGLVECPHAWPHSNFERWVQVGHYANDSSCWCEGRTPKKPSFETLKHAAME